MLLVFKEAQETIWNGLSRKTWWKRRREQDWLGHSPGLCLFVLTGECLFSWGRETPKWSFLYPLDSSTHPGPKREYPMAAFSSYFLIPGRALGCWSTEKQSGWRLWWKWHPVGATSLALPASSATGASLEHISSSVKSDCLLVDL